MSVKSSNITCGRVWGIGSRGQNLMANPVKLAQALPPRLLTFLARYPPVSILPTGTDPATAKTGYQEDTPNPFLPLKHPVTGRWHNPKYSLRRQAELVKMAREHGVEELLPYTPKGTDEKISKRVEFGLRVKGTGVGQQVKGHKHERQMIAKMEKRRQAMLNMPKLIREWKRVGKTKWTKWPK
ncbi:hypothetical protein P8C59_007037 [Phyllachora maydis]|uniref:Large ribosomal subunit protein mL59 domain-containing protein n=1 Tax=Phyllachora maydis TaxID=1825666 RepID=A0AAD9I8Q3_9PEZI|nr:hypothetical protein P8C59_007037 [Phyllachora maydis]